MLGENPDQWAVSGSREGLYRRLAPAKVNLSLLVGPRRPDGYHPLLTVFAPLSLCDEIEFMLTVIARAGVPAPGRVEVECPGIRCGGNLVTLALAALEEAAGRRFVGHVRIKKAIPVGAGLGGGSSDAAAALLAGAEVLAGAGGPRLGPADLLGLARSLGADVPFFLDPSPALAEGVGDVLSPLPLPPLPLVLYLPREELPTAVVYHEFDRLGERAAAASGTSAAGSRRVAGDRAARGAREDDMGAAEFASRAERVRGRWVTLSESWVAGAVSAAGALDAIAAMLHNDLERASFSLLPELYERKAALTSAGARGTLMSGSGPTLFGIWATEVEAAEAAACLRAQGHGVCQVISAG